jgi:hypothetical protein
MKVPSFKIWLPVSKTRRFKVGLSILCYNIELPVKFGALLKPYCIHMPLDHSTVGLKDVDSMALLRALSLLDSFSFFFFFLMSVFSYGCSILERLTNTIKYKYFSSKKVVWYNYVLLAQVVPRLLYTKWKERSLGDVSELLIIVEHFLLSTCRDVLLVTETFPREQKQNKIDPLGVE